VERTQREWRGWPGLAFLASFGAKPSGARSERVRHSPQFRDGAFRNPVATRTLLPRSGGNTLREMMFGDQKRTPTASVPVVTAGHASRDEPRQPPGGLAITWYGHASVLVEIDGYRVLFDPVWSQRCSPSQRVGPRRLHPVPLPLRHLPELDAIVISHDHYDHLDMATVRTLARLQRAPFLVPLGVGAHLERWKVPADRIVEMDWSQSHQIGDLHLIAAAARHFSGRTLTRNYTLWASWVLSSPNRRVFYTGDSGYFDGYAAIGAAYGPFDASLIQIGAYGPDWPEIHMTPEEAVAAHVDLNGGLLIPVHWATFVLAFHAWAEPADRLWLEAKAQDVALAIPRPGERVNVDDPPTVDGWWQALA
jgi:L-ascorbate metabolism protein UlaG (beta-lactamase superfamily)